MLELLIRKYIESEKIDSSIHSTTFFCIYNKRVIVQLSLGLIRIKTSALL